MSAHLPPSATRIERTLARSITLAKAEGMLKGIADNLDDYAAELEQDVGHRDDVLRGFAIDCREVLALLEQFRREQVAIP